MNVFHRWGRTTEWLSERMPHLTAVEIDPDLARKVRARKPA